METVFVRNINLVFAICVLVFSLIFFKKISKESRIRFYIIIALCIFLTATSQFEEYLGNLSFEKAAEYEMYNKCGGDIMRTSLSVLNYALRPTIILLFIQITSHAKWTSFLWIPIGLNIPIYTTAYYSKLSFYIQENSFHGGSIPFFRYYSPIICFLLIGCYFLISLYNYKNKNLKILILNMISGLFAIIVSIVEMKIGGNIFTTTILIALILHFIYLYDMIVNEKEKEFIKNINTDILTGLGNERAYYTYLETIDSRTGNDAKKRYAIALMDLNGLKATDDTYGHRFGCHLIVEFGHQLAEFFKTSKLYHIGGDEFVAIMEDEDFRNRHKLVEQFIEKFSYMEIEFEDKTLILSVAIGIQESEKNKKYNEIFQMADKNMYKNKAIIKRKYKIKNRVEE